MKRLEIKISKLKSTRSQKIFRWILWGVIVFLIFRGVVSIIRPNQSGKILQSVDSTIKINVENTRRLDEAANFAEVFSTEFFTFKQGESDNYRKRLSAYMSDQALTSINSSISAESTAIESKAIYKHLYNENQFNIDVKVKVKTKDITKDLYIKVPIAEKNGRYIVEDMPLFVSRPISASDIELKQHDGNLVESNISKPIEDMLNNFLKVYTQGNEGEIKYYLSDPNINLRGLEGMFKFKNIIESKIYPSANNFLAIITFSMEDTDTKQEFKQKIHLDISNKDNRYYIDNIDTRTINLKEAK